MKRIFSILFALALVLAFSLVTTPAAAATTRYVPSGYSTIQAAINAASPGDTIVVAAGTYDEIVVINKTGLTVQAGSKPLIKPTGAAVFPNIGAVNIMANGVTFDGFEVDASLMTGDRAGINAYGVSDVTIKNNEVHGVTGGSWHGMGIVAWDWDGTKTVDRATIEHNEVYDTGRMGIFCMDYDTTSSKYDLTEGHIIRGNTVHDTWKKGDAWGDAGGAIQINVGKDCAIEHNEIYGTASSVYGLHLNPGIYMFGSGTGNVITCNTIRQNTAGVTLWISGGGSAWIDWEGDTATSPDVFRNNIYNNTNYGACNSGTPVITMDAEDNWWGDDSGPYHSTNPTGVGNKVSDNVDFTPWIDKSVTPTAGPPGTANFATSDGNILGLTAVTPPATPPVTLPYGMFNFTICCIPSGGTVTLTVTLPAAVPVGTKWYKYNGGAWDALTIGGGGTNVITVTLHDGNPKEDEDLTVNGQIIDQGGPGGGGAVGWETYPANKVRVLLPWIALFAAIMAGVSLLVVRRRRVRS